MFMGGAVQRTMDDEVKTLDNLTASSPSGPPA